ncbi:MAG: carbohydrate ABC transporter permease [Bacillota bacterium]
MATNLRDKLLNEKPKNSLSERVYPYISTLPALLVIALFTIYPVITAFLMSFLRYILTNPLNHPFIGFGNFIEVIGSYYFKNSLIITLIYTVFAVAGVIIFGLIVSLLMNAKLKTSNWLKILILLPWAVPTVVAGLLWKWILNSDFGVFNGVLYSMGLIRDYIPFLSDPALAKLSLIIAHVWKEGPLVAIFFLSGLQLIPPQLYESARIDGVTGWQQFRLITLPLLRPIFLVVLVYETMTALLSFDLVYVMTGGGPADATSLISWFAYSEIYKSLNLGHGLALSIILAVLTIVLIIGYLRALKTDYTIN